MSENYPDDKFDYQELFEQHRTQEEDDELDGIPV